MEKENVWNQGTYKTPYLRIQITNRHIDAKGVWVMNVREFGWSCKPFPVNEEHSIEEIQKIAINFAKEHLLKMINSL